MTRTKKNVVPRRRYSHAVDKSTGVRSGQTGILGTAGSARAYPETLRPVSYVAPETNERLKIPANNFTLPALTMADALHPQTLVTYGTNGGDLPAGPGGPLGLRVPRQLGY